MALQDEIRDYVNMCHGDAWRRAYPAEPDEPALVSAFLSEEMYPGLRDILRKYASPSTKVLVRGVFTHQTPKVFPKGETQSVEIGDLMIVHHHVSTMALQPPSGRAMLFQAKKTRTARTGSLANGTEAIQFRLYQSWPEFQGETRLAAQPVVTSRYWNFHNSSVNAQSAIDGAEYLTVFKGHAYETPSFTPQWKAPVSHGPDVRFVKKNYPNASTWSVGGCPQWPAPAKKGVSCKTDFSNIFFDFLHGNKGRAFQPGRGTSTTDHWSLFVNQMLAISSDPTYAYKLANQGILSGYRGRILSLSTNAPVLVHAAMEEILEFIATATGQSATTDFELTNSLLQWMESGTATQAFDGHDLPPVNMAGDVLSDLPGGHVPLLLIMTCGPDELPFTPLR